MTAGLTPHRVRRKPKPEFDPALILINKISAGLIRAPTYVSPPQKRVVHKLRTH